MRQSRARIGKRVNVDPMGEVRGECEAGENLENGGSRSSWVLFGLEITRVSLQCPTRTFQFLPWKDLADTRIVQNQVRFLC